MIESSLFVQFFSKLYRIICLNLIWILFVIFGGVVFGFFPACATLVQVLKTTENQMPDIRKDFKLFKKVYKEVFVFFNKVAMICYLGLSILALNLSLSLQIETFRGLFLFIDLLIIIIIAFSISFCNLLLFRYDRKSSTSLQNFLMRTWIYAFIDLKGTLLLMGSSSFLGYIFFVRFPAFLCFGGVVLLFKINQKITSTIIKKVEKKIQNGDDKYEKNDCKTHQTINGK